MWSHWYLCQLGIRSDAGKRLDIHTKVMKELEVGDCVQLQNLRGKHPLTSDRADVVTAKNGFANYSLKIFGSGLVTKINRATLRKVDPRSIPRGQSEHLLLGQELRAEGRVESREPPVRREPSQSVGTQGGGWQEEVPSGPGLKCSVLKGSKTGPYFVSLPSLFRCH